MREDKTQGKGHEGRQKVYEGGKIRKKERHHLNNGRKKKVSKYEYFQTLIKAAVYKVY